MVLEQGGYFLVWLEHSRKMLMQLAESSCHYAREDNYYMMKYKTLTHAAS